MNKIKSIFLNYLLGAVIFLSFLLSYESIAQTEENSPAQQLKSRIESVFAGKEIEINDYDNQLKKVIVNSEPMFASHDGRYVFSGPIYDTHQRIDIVSEQEAALRRKLLSDHPAKLFVNYPSTVEEKYQITVVTDVDCTYCRKLHTTLGELNKQGVSVNYLMLPRAGVNSKSYSKTLRALCSDDAAINITRAMARETLSELPQDCDPSRLTQQMKLVQSMKIRSTPTFVLPDGKLQVGLVSPARLMGLLDKIKL